jgi:type II secretory pathway pseudopilin PulG
MTGGKNRNQGFTLIELISIILLVGIISVVATAKWPGDMKEEAAAKEFKRALRYAQHQAMTREYDPANNLLWGLTVTSPRYSILRLDGTILPDFTNRFLLEDNTINLTVTAPATNDLWFNGLGEPVDATGAALTTEVSYVIADTENLTVCQETGYVVEGTSCP